jgi:hypothetical protein
MAVGNNGLLDGIKQIPARLRALDILGGLPGAPLGFRLRGATAYGAPSKGTWKTGDMVPDRTGAWWTCTAGGTPGTWVPPGPYFNVLNYGADPTGNTDSAPAIQAAINAALYLSPAAFSAWDSGATGYGCGTVVFPRGRYLCDSSLNCTQVSTDGGYGVTLTGAGKQATSIVKNVTGALCTFNGSGGPDSNPSIMGGLQDITLDGGGNTGALLQTASAQRMYFANVSADNNPDLTWDLTSIQDSYFFGCTSNNAGSLTHRAMEIKGDGTGTSNMLYFTGCRIEAFLLGAVGLGNGIAGIFFSDFKFESTLIAGDIVTCDSSCQEVSFRDGFLGADSFNSGFSTKVNGIVWGDGTTSPGNNKLTVDNLSMYGSSTTASVVKVNGSNLTGLIRLDSIDCYDTPSVGIVSLTNPNASLVITGDAVPVLSAVTVASSGTTITPSAQYMEITSAGAYTAALAAGSVPGQQLTLANTGGSIITISSALASTAIASHTQHVFTWSANQSKWIG